MAAVLDTAIAIKTKRINSRRVSVGKFGNVNNDYAYGLYRKGNVMNDKCGRYARENVVRSLSSRVEHVH